ncbi:ATP-binding protein [Actinocrinis puniceicyclus]|uniref:ATP-binding protein n=1 Tax=Actinocrinis puniceicyclus TaxID=977794 RepID=A0A8J7WL68_9ACTN|nr:ATP-binding protein [Actinocrinis puniceicyclus]MBS2961534.1 ATP-binding protein [Actinocrinis puniceicyclus]
MDADTLDHLLKDRCYPLRPAIETQDYDRYLPLDDIENRFTYFVDTHKDKARFHRSGHLVYVTGGSGSGKTSMIHRCAYHLKQLLDEVILIDLSSQRWVERDKELRMRRTFREILGQLRRIVDVSVVSRLLSELEGDVIQAFRELSSTLAKLTPQRVLVVLLSPEPTAEELAMFAAATEPRLVFFAELSDIEQIRRSQTELPNYQSPQRSVVELRVGRLKPGDGKLLVDGIAQYEQGLPTIPDDIVEKWIERNARSILLLKRLTLGVRLLARERNASTVGPEDVLEYLTLMLHGQEGR